MLKNLLKDKNYGIAFSGGSDSLFAAHLCRYRNPILYHFNHKLSEDDDVIATQAETAAKLLGLQFVCKASKERYNKGMGSVEGWCRKRRYEWLGGIGGTIVTAHHLSDATESYLLNCFSGHPEYLPIPISSQFGISTIVRPFILWKKEDINNYLFRKGLEPLIVKDWLNEDLSKRRNWLRKVILPQIKEKTNVETVVRKLYIKFLNKNP